MERLFSYSGTYDPFNFRREDVNMEDIARGLACTPRWRGQTQDFYSVAEHSLMVASRCSDPLRLWGLLHDAAEVYLNDEQSPVKALMYFHVPDSRGVIQRRMYEEVEHDILRVILSVNGIEVAPGAPVIPMEVHEADLIIREWERHTLVRPTYQSRYRPMAPGEAMERWLGYYYDLMALNQALAEMAVANG